jgi:glycerol kinase
VWSSLDEVGRMWKLDARFEPAAPSGRHDTWKRAVERSLRWASDAD